MPRGRREGRPVLARRRERVWRHLRQGSPTALARRSRRRRRKQVDDRLDVLKMKDDVPDEVEGEL
jgi:hypothetical protein